MAQTTTTILVHGTYNGPNSGGPFPIPAGTSEIEIDVNITDAPPGANVTFVADTSDDGGTTWKSRVTLSCSGGTVTTKLGVVRDASCSSQMGIDLDPSLNYLARFRESSDVPITANATITIF